MFGSLVFGPMADRYGRRPVLMISVAFFGMATLLALLASNVTEFAALRFIAGMGIGGASPMAVTMTAEYAPLRKRLTLITAMMCGNSMGSALGGVIASSVIPRFGWHAMLLVGGLMPVALIPILWFFLPESLRFVALRRADRQDLMRGLARRIAPMQVVEGSVFIAQETKVQRFAVAELLTPTYRVGTLLLWTTFFMGLSVLFLMASWLPTLITHSGGSMKSAALTTALWSIGGTVGGLLLGRLMDLSFPTRVLGIAYAVGCVLTYCVGQFYTMPAILGPLAFAAGFCISGSQVGVNGIAATFYPTAMRATGVAWATGIGRMGSILGSAVGGLLISSGMAYGTLFTIVAIPALIAAICIISISKVRIPAWQTQTSAPASDVRL